MTSDESNDDERRWVNRRALEADAAGITAARARQEILRALDAGDYRMARAASAAYAVLVEQAEALTGIGAEAGSQQQTKGTPLDELYARRAQRQADATRSA